MIRTTLEHEQLAAGDRPSTSCGPPKNASTCSASSRSADELAVSQDTGTLEVVGNRSFCQSTALGTNRHRPLDRDDGTEEPATRSLDLVVVGCDLAGNQRLHRNQKPLRSPATSRRRCTGSTVKMHAPPSPGSTSSWTTTAMGEILERPLAGTVAADAGTEERRPAGADPFEHRIDSTDIEESASLPTSEGGVLGKSHRRPGTRADSNGDRFSVPEFRDRPRRQPHRARGGSVPSGWPGGVPPQRLPVLAVGRDRPPGEASGSSPRDPSRRETPRRRRWSQRSQVAPAGQPQRDGRGRSDPLPPACSATSVQGRVTGTSGRARQSQPGSSRHSSTIATGAHWCSGRPHPLDRKGSDLEAGRDGGSGSRFVTFSMW